MIHSREYGNVNIPVKNIYGGIIKYESFFKDLEWKPGDSALVQGVKNNRVPRNAIAGGNGSFICRVPAELILTVTTPQGTEISRDIISVVKRVNDWQKLSQQRFYQLKMKLKAINVFEFDENAFIVDIEKHVVV